MKKQDIIQRIKDNFVDAEFPKHKKIFIPSANHIFDAHRAEAEIYGKRWKQIPLDVLIRTRDRISYLTEDGFWFLLPAFLIAIIDHPRKVDVLRDNIIHVLTPPIPSDSSVYASFKTRINTLSNLQARVIADFFENFTNLYPVDEWSFTEEDAIQVTRAHRFWVSKAQGTNE